LSSLLCHGSNLSRKGASGKPGEVQTDFSKNWRFLLRGIIYLTSREQNQGELELIDAEVLDGLHRMTHLAQQSGRHLAESVVATSPIRTEPQRTYTPTGATVDGEGSHVPFEIAKMYRSRNKNAWYQLKEKLESFGKESQMFRQIDVKSFGHTTDDPFQLQFSFDGPKMNLVDLGYGTSQVLPIVFHIAQSKRRTRFLIQQPEVHLHAKAQASLGQFFVESYIEKRSSFVIETHSDFIIDRFRLAVREGKISPEDISILFFQRKRLEDEIDHIELDKNGEPVDPPDAYRTFFIDEQMKILVIR